MSEYCIELTLAHIQLASTTDNLEDKELLNHRIQKYSNTHYQNGVPYFPKYVINIRN